jgi:hypothetical protein
MSIDGIIKNSRNEIYSDGVDWIVGHRVGTSADSCTHGPERPGTIKCGEFLDYRNAGFPRLTAFVHVRFVIRDCAWGIVLIDAFSVCVTASFSLRCVLITGESSLG